MIHTLILIAVLQAPGPALTTSKPIAGTFATCEVAGRRAVELSKSRRDIFRSMRFECVPTRKASK